MSNRFAQIAFVIASGAEVKHLSVDVSMRNAPDERHSNVFKRSCFHNPVEVMV